MAAAAKAAGSICYVASTCPENSSLASFDLTDSLESSRCICRSARRERAPEKPLLEISADELSTYKDTFVLDDRALLLFDYVRRQLGPERFFDLTRGLFGQPELTAASFEATLVRFLPDARDAIHRWLHTADYPPEFRLPPEE